MKKLNQFKVAFITLDGVMEMPIDAPVGSRFPAGCLYVPAKNVVYQNISDGHMLSICQAIELNGADVSTVVNFSWSREDLSSDELMKSNKPKILRVLNDGVVIDGMKGVYTRFLRTPSQSRAGGAWLSNNSEEMRNIVSYSLEHNYETDFDIVPSKWEASLSLSCTTSNPVSLGRMIKIQVIPDLYREVTTTVTTVDTDENFPNPLGLLSTKGMAYKKLSDRKSKKIGNPDIEYTVSTKQRVSEIALGDGNALATPELFELAGTSLQMTAEEKAHFTLLQFRGLPGCKGTATKFDIADYCNEKGITEMTNIYGEKFDPREVDMLMYESCFKWSDRFTSMADYYNKTILASFPVTRKHSQFYIRNRYASVQSIADVVTDLAKDTAFPYNKLFIHRSRVRGSRKLKAVRVPNLGRVVNYVDNVPYFKNNEILRVANITKEKEAYHKLTYQYLQSLMKIDVDGLIPLTQPIYRAVVNATTDISVAKALFGMIHNDDTDKYSRSLVSKATEVMELKQEAFRSRFVQRRVLSTVKNLVQDQKRGSVMCKGGYYFIAPEPAIFFYQKGIKKGKNGRYYVPTLKEKAKLGLIARGKSYLRGQSGVTLGFRSPLIHASEVAQLDFNNKNKSELDRWYGHLYGVILFNSYDTTALRMGGADYDGDKIYMLDSHAPENDIIVKYYQPNLPLIVSPLENLSAKKYPVSKSRMLEVDERTLQNYTGIYTNMGTYYCNLKYHVSYRFDSLLNMLKTQDARFWTEFQTVMPIESYANINLNVLSYDDVRDLIKAEYKKIVDWCEYCITLIRIAQAGEIDFTKHGTRFALPMNVETERTPLWLKDYIVPKQGVTISQAEYGMIEYSWKTEFGERKLYKMDTPMQRLCDDVDKYYQQAVSQVKENSLTDTMSLFLGSDYIIPESVKAIYADVQQVAMEYGQELANLSYATKGMSKEVKNAKYQVVYNKYTDICAKFSDRKALAISGLFFEQSTNSTSNFTFVCCYDGLIEILLEQPSVSPRIARISVADWVDTIYVDVEGRVGYAMPGSYETFSIDIPFINTYCNLEVKDGKVETVNTATAEVTSVPVCLKDGVYPYNGKSFIVYDKFNIKLPTVLKPGSYVIKSYFGKKYISFGYMLSEDGKKELSDAHYNNRTAQGRSVKNDIGKIVGREHVIETVAGKRDKFQIVGMGKVAQPTNAVEVAELIKEYNGQCMVVESTKDDGTTAPMLSIGGRIVGMIATKDNLKIKKDYVVNYRQMYGHVFRLSVVGATRKIDGTPLMSLEVLAKVESLKPFTNPINKVHSRCDLSKWYWNVEWKTFKDFGYSFSNVEFHSKPVDTNCFATVALDYCGQLVSVVVGFKKSNTSPLYISDMVCNGQSLDMSQLTQDFEAVVYRAVSFFFSK